MTIVYEATFSIKLRSLIPEIMELEETINSALKDNGCEEKISSESEIFTARVEVGRELSDEEKYKMRALLEAQVIKSMPKYDIRLKTFGLQSGNAQQSVSQSVE